VFLVGLLADELRAQCPALVQERGPYIWTAGRRWPGGGQMGPWYWTLGHREEDGAMFWYSNWTPNAPPTQYYWDCINIWMYGDWKWNKLPCGEEICFVCENRSAQLICDDCFID